MKVLCNIDVSQEMEMDHREGIRRRALALVKIEFKRNYSAGLMYDISPDGMYILSENLPDINDCVDVFIPLPIKKDTPVRIPAMVVHRNKNGFGLMFRGLDSDIRTCLSEIFSRYHAWT